MSYGLTPHLMTVGDHRRRRKEVKDARANAAKAANQELRMNISTDSIDDPKDDKEGDWFEVYLDYPKTNSPRNNSRAKGAVVVNKTCENASILRAWARHMRRERPEGNQIVNPENYTMTRERGPMELNLSGIIGNWLVDKDTVLIEYKS